MDERGHAREIGRALEHYRHGVRRLALLSAPDPRKRGRSTWRVDLDDGGMLKARRLESATSARELVVLREDLDDAFSRAVGRHGAVLLEEWVEGEPLPGDGDAARAGEAGALLGGLHRRSYGTISTAPWRAQADRDLDSLLAARALAGPDVDALRAALARHDPREARAAKVHRDFCAENMLVDREARLRVIDNEWFSIDAAGLDLGRTLYRWPMSVSARRTFLDAYGRAAEAEPGPLDFWTLVAVLWSARARLGQAADRQAVPLDAARRLAAGGGAPR